jgi:hypothetical protein
MTDRAREQLPDLKSALPSNAIVVEPSTLLHQSFANRFGLALPRHACQLGDEPGNLGILDGKRHVISPSKCAGDLLPISFIRMMQISKIFAET